MKKLSDIFSKSGGHPVLVKPDSKLANWGFLIIALGQALKYLQYDDGSYFAPAFLRHHLSNIADALTVAAVVNGDQMILARKLGKEVKSRPVLCAAFALAVGTGWECYQATWPNRTFDIVDESCYAVSTGVYAAIRTRQDRRETGQG